MVDTGWMVPSAWWIGTIPVPPMGSAEACIILTRCCGGGESFRALNHLLWAKMRKHYPSSWGRPISFFYSPLKHCGALCSPLPCLGSSLQDRALWLPCVCLVLQHPPSYLCFKNQCVYQLFPGKQPISFFWKTKIKAESTINTFFEYQYDLVCQKFLFMLMSLIKMLIAISAAEKSVKMEKIYLAHLKDQIWIFFFP